MDEGDIKMLCKTALDARENAYSPYSSFAVGAALLADDGSVFKGVNVENASYPAGCCAERSALFAAVSSGKRNFKAIAIAGGASPKSPKDFCTPCGICRQSLSEFCSPDFHVISAKTPDDYRIFTLGELLPESFGKDSLCEK